MQNRDASVQGLSSDCARTDEPAVMFEIVQQASFLIDFFGDARSFNSAGTASHRITTSVCRSSPDEKKAQEKASPLCCACPHPVQPRHAEPPPRCLRTRLVETFIYERLVKIYRELREGEPATPLSVQAHTIAQRPGCIPQSAASLQQPVQTRKHLRSPRWYSRTPGIRAPSDATKRPLNRLRMPAPRRIYTSTLPIKPYALLSRRTNQHAVLLPVAGPSQPPPRAGVTALSVLSEGLLALCCAGHAPNQNRARSYLLLRGTNSLLFRRQKFVGASLGLP